MNDTQEKKTTHFGYQEVPFEEKTAKVANVFHSVANKYDLMNDLMSFGIHRIWKHFALNLCALRNGQTVLDLAGGTGDLAAKISKIVGHHGQVILADINASMLQIGRDKLLDQGIYQNLMAVQANAETLPFANDYFDRIIIGFGLRNVTHKEKALASMFRVLKPGGRLLILEFSKPTLPGLKAMYDAYSFKILPVLGKLIANDADSYRYLAESIRMHPDQLSLQTMLESVGFEQCSYHNLTGGIVAVHRGYKY